MQDLLFRDFLTVFQIGFLGKKSCGKNAKHQSGSHIIHLTYHGGFSILGSLFYDFSAGGSSNGRTADSDSAYRGSNPCPPATFLFLMYFHSNI